MRDSQAILYSLSKNAQNCDYVFDRLYRLLYNKNLYYKALSKIYNNNGSSTKGVDNSTIDGINDMVFEKLIQLLQSEQYQPKPVRRTYIRKKNGKLRPLGIPSFEDRLIQEICRVILDTIYEPLFSQSSHGFRENRSCHTALHEIELKFQGVNWFIEGDIESYFDSIDHNVLINILRRRIKDEKFIRLIWKLLRAGYMEDWIYGKTYSGTPQGGIISPILANIYLNELDMFIENELKPSYDTGKPKAKRRNPVYRQIEYKLGRIRKQIDNETNADKRTELIKEAKEGKKELVKTQYYLTHSKNHKCLRYVRYADDFLIGVIGSKDDCEMIKSKIKDFLNDTLKIKLSEEKTLITHSTDKARFLGYNVTICNNISTVKDKNGVTKRVYRGDAKLLIPKGTIEKMIVKNGMVKDINAEQWNTTHRPYLIRLTDLEIISVYNGEIRGMYNYYCMAESVSVIMWKLWYVMNYSCLKTFACKYKSSVAKIRTKYRIDKNWGVKYMTKTGEKQTVFHNSFTRNRKPCLNIEIDTKPRNGLYFSTTELEKRLKANKCELCGIENVQMNLHHVNKVKNLKGKERWEKVMIAKRRKTLVVCEECHKSIHYN